jgi:hypothetical protein
VQQNTEDDRPTYALTEFEQQFPLPADGRLALRARWPAQSLLHVRDRLSAAELNPVWLVPVTGWFESDFLHPGVAARNAKDFGPSPVSLSAEHGVGSPRRTLYASSPGYAWGKIQIDDKLGGERILLLDRGGDLDIRLHGSVEEPNLVLRMLVNEFDVVFEIPVNKRESLEVNGLLPGSYTLHAQIGEFWKEPLELGTTQVEIVAGQSTLAELTIQAPQRAARVPLAGTLRIPAEWELGSFALRFELQGTDLGGGSGQFRIPREQMQSVAESPTLYSWKAPDVQPGRYEVLLPDLAFSVVLDVPAQGLVDVRIEVPPPAEIEVSCVDDVTGVFLGGAKVAWRCKPPEGVHSWSFTSAAWDAQRNCHYFQGPVGHLLVSADCPNYARNESTFEAALGTNAIELRLKKLCGLKPILRDGETEIPWGGGLRPQLEAAEGQAEYSSWSTTGSAITLLKIDSGLYTLKIPQIPGFEPVADELVRLEKGQVIEHTVHLVRAR